MRYSFLLLLWLPFFMSAQKGDLRGIAQDSATGQPLAFASVALWQLPDSLPVQRTVTNEQGAFEFTDVQSGSCLLKINLLGYAPFVRRVVLPAAASVTCLLVPADQVLQNVTIQEKRVPILLNGDTVVYNAEAFSVKENAVAEDLLKKLPGVEVDRQGNIKALGQEVKQVLVDGKPFFGNDPKAATKNLPADAIDQVKVYDKRSDQSTFSGFDDGSGEKVVDIRLKADRRRGQFGRLTAAAGTENRQAFSGMYNRFSPRRQVSVLGSANNINDAGFSMEELLRAGLIGINGGGGMAEGDGENSGSTILRGGMTGGEDGITRSFTGGLNYWHDLNAKFAIDGNLMLNGMDTRLEQSLWRQNFYTDSIIDFRQQTLNGDRRFNPRLRVETDWKLDSFNTLNLKINSSYTARTSENERQYSFSTRAENPFQTGRNEWDRDMDRARVNAALLWKHRFRQPGHTFSTQLQVVSQPVLSTEENSFFTTDTLRQQWQQHDDNNTALLKSVYTRPLRKRNRFIEVSYLAARSVINAHKDTYDADPETGLYDQRNAFFSNDLQYEFVNQQAGLQYRRQRLRYDYSFGAATQYSLLDAATATAPDSGIYRHFVHLLPNGTFRLNVGKSAFWRFKLQSGVQMPAVRYLLPAADNTNPQVLRLPNARLQPEVRYTAQTNYQRFSMAQMTTLMGNASLSLVRHRIASDIVRGAGGQQVIRPVNTDAGWVATLFGLWNTPLRNRNFRFSAEGHSVLNAGYSFLNAQRNNNLFWMKGGGLRMSWEKGDHIFTEAGIQMDHQYNRNTASVPAANQFWNLALQGGGEYGWGKGWRLSSEMSWNRYLGNSTRINSSFLLINASIGRKFLKKEAGFLELVVHDALNQNQAIQRTPGDGYLEELRNSALKRYFLLRFTCRFLPAGASGSDQGGGHGIRIRM